MIRRAQRSHHQRDNTASIDIAAIGIYGAAMLPPPRSRSQQSVRSPHADVRTRGRGRHDRYL